MKVVKTFAGCMVNQLMQRITWKWHQLLSSCTASRATSATMTSSMQCAACAMSWPARNHHEKMVSVGLQLNTSSKTSIKYKSRDTFNTFITYLVLHSFDMISRIFKTWIVCNTHMVFNVLSFCIVIFSYVPSVSAYRFF